MLLIGMLDSPYVRRTAASLRFLGLPYEHRLLSVFRDMPQFREINPVLKAPTMVTDDGVVLMDSTLMIEHAEDLAAERGAKRSSLMPAVAAERIGARRLIGLALAACEKTVAIVYENELRPTEHRHEPWLARVRDQLVAACCEIEQEIAARTLAVTSETIEQPAITAAVAWTFLQFRAPDVVVADRYPAWRGLAAAVETLPEFAALPLD
jgi:glutathione S-transferase